MAARPCYLSNDHGEFCKLLSSGLRLPEHASEFVMVDDDALLMIKKGSRSIYEFSLSTNEWHKRKENIPVPFGDKDWIFYDFETQHLYINSDDELLYVKDLSREDSPWIITNIEDLPTIDHSTHVGTCRS